MNTDFTSYQLARALLDPPHLLQLSGIGDVCLMNERCPVARTG